MIEKIKNTKNIKFFSGVFALSLALVVSYLGAPFFFVENYEKVSKAVDNIADIIVPQAEHLDTPESVRGIYMTSWVAGTPELRDGIVKLIEETELNTIVIDIKDDTGKISYKVSDKELEKFNSYENRIPDIKEFIKSLHQKDIYVIGRVAVFQDPFMTKERPDLAVKKASDKSTWVDRKGLSWIDAGSKEHWEYISLIAKDAYSQGFDEINFDYIRFPSDGQMEDIYYPFSEERILADPDLGKAKIVKEFFSFLDRSLEDIGPISADLFGMTTTNEDDLNIGQILEFALPYFDYISPMTYPSHYPPGFFGIENVNAEPYQVVSISLNKATERVRDFKIETASSTPSASFLPNISSRQIRPWLQDNDYPVPYPPEAVRAQIQATYDAGLNSWLLWDAANTYTRAALETNL